MSRINIQQAHGMDHEDAIELADRIAEDLADKFSMDYGWEEQTLYFERPGVHGQIEVSDTNIHIQAQLGFLLIALKGRIEDEINKVLAESFA